MIDQIKQNEERDKLNKEREELKKVNDEKKRLEAAKVEKEAEALRKRQALSEEPAEKDAEACHIVFRMPGSGERVSRRFLKGDKIESIYNFVDSLGPEKLQLENHEKGYSILQSMPRKEFNNKEKTLGEVGLHPRAMLQIKENE